ncbi:MAG TPA: hypothetical protein VK731_13725 [Candidatus Cybelea sp.]|jgi:hypothetical protein|nr:hypothetical protein [Candidatus Cybelea sp.]
MAIPDVSYIKTFRLSLTWMFGFYFAIALIGYFSTLLLLVCFHPHIYLSWRVYLRGSVIFAFVSFALALIIKLVFTYKLTTEGVRGYSFWGIRRFIQWQHIQKVRTCGWSILPCLLLYSKEEGSSAVWLALFLKNRGEFAAECHKLALPDNPLLKFL